jgi:E3 ubiquitin-protein ligase HACE1
VLLADLLNPDYALFERSETTGAYQPNSKSAINPDHLRFFKFAGMQCASFVGNAFR